MWEEELVDPSIDYITRNYMHLHAEAIIIITNRVTNRHRCTMLDYVLNDD